MTSSVSMEGCTRKYVVLLPSLGSDAHVEKLYINKESPIKSSPVFLTSISAQVQILSRPRTKPKANRLFM